MMNDVKLVRILQVQGAMINQLVDAVNKLGELQGSTWNTETKQWEPIKKEAVNG